HVVLASATTSSRLSLTPIKVVSNLDASPPYTKVTPCGLPIMLSDDCMPSRTILGGRLVNIVLCVDFISITGETFGTAALRGGTAGINASDPSPNNCADAVGEIRWVSTDNVSSAPRTNDAIAIAT